MEAPPRVVFSGFAGSHPWRVPGKQFFPGAVPVRLFCFCCFQLNRAVFTPGFAAFVRFWRASCCRALLLFLFRGWLEGKETETKRSSGSFKGAIPLHEFLDQSLHSGSVPSFDSNGSGLFYDSRSSSFSEKAPKKKRLFARTGWLRWHLSRFFRVLFFQKGFAGAPGESPHQALGDLPGRRLEAHGPAGPTNEPFPPLRRVPARGARGVGWGGHPKRAPWVFGHVFVSSCFFFWGGGGGWKVPTKREKRKELTAVVLVVVDITLGSMLKEPPSSFWWGDAQRGNVESPGTGRLCGWTWGPSVSLFWTSERQGCWVTHKQIATVEGGIQ